MDKGIIFLGVGFELVGLCLGGYFLGKYIDDYMGWKSAATTGLVILLMLSWFFHLFILLKRFDEDAKSDDPSSQP